MKNELKKLIDEIEIKNLKLKSEIKNLKTENSRKVDFEKLKKVLEK